MTSPAPKTPSTVSSKSTSQSKYDVVMMDELALESPQPSKKNNKDDSTDESLCEAVDHVDSYMIELLTEKGLNSALQYNFSDPEDYADMNYYDKAIKLTSEF